MCNLYRSPKVEVIEIPDEDVPTTEQPSTSTCTVTESTTTPTSPPANASVPVDLTINPRKRHWEESSDDEESDSTIETTKAVLQVNLVTLSMRCMSWTTTPVCVY